MPPITFVDGSDLNEWAKRREAQAVLPQLVRRLVHGTLPPPGLTRVGFPAGEGVQLGGWDGIVVAEGGNAYVPNGVSAWELRTDRDITPKADKDYTKRWHDQRGID